MEQRQEPQINAEKTREALAEAKDSLTRQAKQLSLKENMAKHPYLSLGAVFFSGVLLGGSGEARRDISRVMIEVAGKELLRRREKNR